MSDRVRGTDEAPRYRAKMKFAICAWSDHVFTRYIHLSVGDGETMFMLCDYCGRTPYETLLELDVIAERVRGS